MLSIRHDDVCFVLDQQAKLTQSYYPDSEPVLGQAHSVTLSDSEPVLGQAHSVTIS
jgi:hypothetical protein